jgi:VWFA-related protein
MADGGAHLKQGLVRVRHHCIDMSIFHAPLLRMLLIAAVLTTTGYPQQKPEDVPPSIKVEVNLVNVLASVRDRHGALISNLTKDDFQIFEDGKQQEIKYFARETDLPLTIGLLVDVSASQQNLIEIERRAAYEFFSKVLRKKDMAFLISFGAEAELLQDSTGSPRLLQAGLDGLRVNSGVGGLHPGPVPTISQPRGTVLYDAVYLAATEKLTREVGRKVIVLITDGEDQGSRLDIKKAIEAAQKADTVVYSMYYVDQGFYRSHGMFLGVSDSALRKMSDETGGRVFHVDRKVSLSDAFDQLQQEMRSQYSIAYTPTNGQQDGSFRKLEIRTRDKNLKVQARKGYYAIRPEDR